MGHYYYLVPQLAHLVFGQTPPVSSQEFRAAAMPLLTEEDAALMDLLGLDPQPLKRNEEISGLTYTNRFPCSGSDFIDGWREWERVLRLNLAKFRSAKLKRETAVDPPGSPADAVAAAARAVQETSPLDGEKIIDKARWNAIEALQGTDYFDRNTVFAYLLKLIILERNALFHPETGFSEYKSLYTSILESATQGASPTGEPK
ncbi:MAG: DUF2764 domain-containing protein [Treponema sp.]|nr:DUF2764 domain-containing protein [Treponema sp.]